MTGGRQRIVVTGATGAIGRPLCAALIANGYDVVVLSRDAASARQRAPGATEYRTWTPEVIGDWTNALDGAYAVVHLAGAPVFSRRWSRAYKTRIYTSRVLSTRALVSAMDQVKTPPAVFVSSSGVGYYGYHDDDAKLTEHAPPGTDFLARVCVDWERVAMRAEARGIRTVVLRTGIVLDARDGPLPQMLLPYRFFAGGPILPGNQWVSWIHLEDQIGLIRLTLEDPRAQGPLNAVAPDARRNADFSRAIGQIAHSPAWFPTPRWILRAIFGERADILTTGQRVVPAKAVDLGYTFQYPHLEQALRQLLR